MYPTDVVDWGLGTVPSFMRLSQAKTLALFVAATMRVGRVSLPAIALQAQSTIMLKHKIKRLWRFTDNDRVEVSDAMRGVVQKLLKRRKRRLVVGFDSRGVPPVPHLGPGGSHPWAPQWRCCGPVIRSGNSTRARTTWKKACCGCFATWFHRNCRSSCWPTGVLAARNWPACVRSWGFVTSSALRRTYGFARPVFEGSCGTIRCGRASACCCGTWNIRRPTLWCST